MIRTLALLAAAAVAHTATGAEIVPRDYVVLGRAGRPARGELAIDPVAAAVASGTFSAPKAGDEVTWPDGSKRAWAAANAKEDGTIDDPAARTGYAFTAVESAEDRVMILEASGHSVVYVDGEPRAGDPYGHGYVHLPVRLKAGSTGLLFRGGRGAIRARLVEPKGKAQLDASDATLPDLVAGSGGSFDDAALVVLNAADGPLRGLSIVAEVMVAPELRSGGVIRKGAIIPSATTPVPPLLPLGTRKVGFRIPHRTLEQPGEQAVTIRLVRGEETLDTTTIKLRVRAKDQAYKVTFRSDIDGSVQYYAVNPARSIGERPRDERPALFLSLHGAGVEAIGQAEAYEPKSWGHVVAPTNRRPFGFDWEDWGRLDALEVLEHARERLGTDPRRTYLTGHSMGGHGTWQIGATFPDRFAAIGPSAGWISFWSYGGARRPASPNPVEEMFLRAASPSDTLALATNYANQGVYILHGDDDDNVPVAQARTMKAKLEEFHRDLHSFEQPGAGHWWDASDEPGTDCVDWAPMFDLFARRRLPALDEVRQVDFVTASPGVSSRSAWAEVWSQLHPLRPSSIHLRLDPGLRRVRGTTENVARLALDLGPVPPGGPVVVELDGQTPGRVERPAGGRLWLERRDDGWHATDPPGPAIKGPHRSGPFKDAFRNHFVLVYGTKGSPVENSAMLARARYDAETFWYRGNGSVDVVADVDFDPVAEPDRSVILYGNAESNAAWKPLLGASPVQVRPGTVAVDGGPTLRGDSLACLFLRPRPGSDRASVAAVAATGPVGVRLSASLPYFVSGAAFPDVSVFALADGRLAAVGAGFFGQDWGVGSGEFAWPEIKK